jgi:hypothetical protein
MNGRRISTIFDLHCVLPLLRARFSRVLFCSSPGPPPEKL